MVAGSPYSLALREGLATLERALLVRLQQQDREAFHQVVEEQADRIFRTCLSLVPNREEAEDLAQETFVEAWKALPHFRGESALTTWLYRIAVNQCIEHQRRAGRKKRKGILIRIGVDKNTPDLPAPVTFDHPGYAMEQQERAKALHSALAKLPQAQRIAITLQHFEELSYREIAEVMKTSESAVDSLISRAKAGLRKHLQDFYRTHE